MHKLIVAFMHAGFLLAYILKSYGLAMQSVYISYTYNMCIYKGTIIIKVIIDYIAKRYLIISSTDPGGWMGWLATHHEFYSFVIFHQNCFYI